MPVAGAVIAGVSAVSGMVGASKQRRQQNRMLNQSAAMMSPDRVMDTFRRMNPTLYNAAYGTNPFSGYQNQGGNQSDWYDQQSAMSNVVNDNPLAQLFHAPGYIDPRMMNFGLQQSDQAQQQQLAQGIALLGRSAFQGGLADAFAMATQAKNTENRLGMYNQYQNARAQKTTQDIATGQGMLQSAQQQATNLNTGQANILSQRQAPQNGYQMFSQGASAALGGYGAMRGLGGPPAGNVPQQGPPAGNVPQQGGQGPISNAPGWGPLPSWQAPTQIPLSPPGGTGYQTPTWANPPGGWS